MDSPVGIQLLFLSSKSKGHYSPSLELCDSLRARHLEYCLNSTRDASLLLKISGLRWMKACTLSDKEELLLNNL